MQREGSLKLTRRSIGKGIAFTAVAASMSAGILFPAPVLRAGPTSVNFSLSWLPAGGMNYVYLAKPKWLKRGLEVPIARAYGSALLLIGKRLQLQMIRTHSYYAAMSLAMKEEEPIKTPTAIIFASITCVCNLALEFFVDRSVL